MKARILFFCLVLLVSSVASIYAQNKEEKSRLQEQVLKEIVGSGKYEVVVNMAYPQEGRSIPLSLAYSVKVQNDSLFSQLPYYGRAYSVPYGGGNGLIFKAPIQDYNLTYGKKGDVQIKLSSRTNEDSYEYFITIYPNRTARVSVRMINRQSIGFGGELKVERK